VLARKGTRLNPCHLALLAAAGHEKISVNPVPVVTLLATGSELLKKGEKLQAGKIRDSNTILLEALVKEAGGLPQALPFVGDRLALIRDRIRKGLQGDLFLIAGGVSVGAYDFVKEALKKEGVREISWKVNIKPGKPLFFGRKGKSLVFGLPGNPVSVFVTFEEFIKPVLRKWSSVNPAKERRVSGFLTEKFENGPRLHFVRVRCRFDKNRWAVTPLGGQGSHMIGELASANALLCVEPGAVLKKGEPVTVKILNEDCLS
jgi:molybdopterin molybdotransferase